MFFKHQFSEAKKIDQILVSENGSTMLVSTNSTN